MPCPMPSWSNMIDATWRDGSADWGLAPPSASVDGKAHVAVRVVQEQPVRVRVELARRGSVVGWRYSRPAGVGDVPQSVHDGDTTVTLNSAPFFRADEAAHFDANHRPTGTAPVRVIVDRRNQVSSPFTSWWWSSFDSGSPVQWRSQRVIDWQIPSDVGSNGTTLACLAVGATSCDLVPDGSNVRVGGSGGVACPASEPRARVGSGAGRLDKSGMADACPGGLRGMGSHLRPYLDPGDDDDCPWFGAWWADSAGSVRGRAGCRLPEPDAVV